MRRLLGIAAGAGALAIAAGGAQATELVFTITGAGHIITFDLPQDPTPDTYTQSANSLLLTRSMELTMELRQYLTEQPFGIPIRTPGICT